MKKLKILGVYREPEYSNNAVEADRAILDAVLDRVQIRWDGPMEVLRSEAKELNFTTLQAEQPFDLIFTMAQGTHALAQFVAIGQQSTIVLNPENAIQNCFRVALSEQLTRAELPYPTYSILHTEKPIDRLPFTFDEGYWVKRGDFHAISDDDVLFVKGLSEINQVLEKFSKRNVKTVILQRHIEGQMIKFYGVRDRFFDHRAKDLDFDVNKVEKLAHQAAKLLGLDVFGGDCVVQPNGEIYLIDVNDWPSFRTCRAKAAVAIADYGLSKLDTVVEKR